MIKIDPKLLEKPQTNGSLKRDVPALLMSMIKNSLDKIFDNKILNVKIADEQLQNSVDRLSSIISQLNNNQKNLQVGKTNLTTQTVGEFKVNNLEELNLENVEKLGLAVEQLEPIIASLKKGNQLDQQSVNILSKIVNSLLALNSQIKALKPVEFPIEPLTSKLESIREAINQIKLEPVKSEKISFPEFPKEVGLSQGIKIVTSLEKLQKAIESLPKKFPEIDFPREIAVTNFPPQRIPTPVTHVSINGLRGYIKSRNITVTDALTPLPDEVLSNRRSLVVYNNSAATTVYIGGVDVTSTNGVPVPAQTYSPALDASSNMILYGIVASGTADVRVLEMSDEAYSGK